MERCIWGGKVGEKSALMGSACLSPCSIVLPAKMEKTRMRGKADSKEVKPKCLKGGSLV